MRVRPSSFGAHSISGRARQTRVVLHFKRAIWIRRCKVRVTQTQLLQACKMSALADEPCLVLLLLCIVSSFPSSASFFQLCAVPCDPRRSILVGMTCLGTCFESCSSASLVRACCESEYVSYAHRDTYTDINTDIHRHGQRHIAHAYVCTVPIVSTVTTLRGIDQLCEYWCRRKKSLG